MTHREPGSDFDEEALRELAEDMGDSMGEFVTGFLTSLDATCASMRAALAAGQLDEVGSNAHRLKGTAGYLGAVALVKTLVEIQHRCREDGEPSELEQLLDQADRQANATRQRLSPLVSA